LKQAQKDFAPGLAEPGYGSELMRKALLVFLAVLLMAPMLSGCFFPYRDDWNDRGYYRHDRRYYEDRRYDGHRDGYRDYDGTRDYRDRR
jgi:hypothetical protein